MSDLIVAYALKERQVLKMLKELCLLNGASGDERRVCDFIINEIKDYCKYSVDALGSIIAFKKRKSCSIKEGYAFCSYG